MTGQKVRHIAAAAGLMLTAYLATLVFLFPADAGWRMAEAHTQLGSHLSADAVSGRIWNGRADGLRADGHPVGSITWRLKPASLLRGRLGLSLLWQSGTHQVETRLDLGPGSARVTELRGELDAERIQAWLDLPVLLDGRLSLAVPRMHWSRDSGFASAAGSLAWSGAGAGLPRPLPLGDYRAELASRDGALVAEVDSGPGSVLAVEGTAAWRARDDYRLDLQLSAAANADRNLLAALDSIAQPLPGGQYRLQLVAH